MKGRSNPDLTRQYTEEQIEFMSTHFQKNPEGAAGECLNCKRLIMEHIPDVPRDDRQGSPWFAKCPKPREYYDGTLLDITQPRIVQVQVSKCGGLWVNVEGICRFRVCRAGRIEVDNALVGELNEQRKEKAKVHVGVRRERAKRKG